VRTPLPLLLCLAAPAAAQVPNLPTPPAPAAADTSLAGGLRLAGAYIDAGQPERAIPLLEDLLAANPGSYPVYSRLRETYVAARRFDQVVTLVEARIAEAGASPSLLAERGAALFQAGRPDEAGAAWDDALATAPDVEMTYRLVADAQGALGLYDEAAATLGAGRESLGAGMFHAELAHIHGLAGDAERAGDEWLALVEERPESAELVRMRLARLLSGEDRAGPPEGGAPGVSYADAAAQGLARSAARAVRRAPLSRTVREMSGWLAMQRGEWRMALDEAIAVDRLEMETGQGLVSFGQLAAGAGAHAEAAAAFDAVLERHGDGTQAPLARLGLAELEAARSVDAGERPGAPAPHADAAVAGLEAFAGQHPSHQRAAGALRIAASLARDALGDADEAERLLNAAGALPAVPLAEAVAIRVELARIALRRGALVEARALFTSVEESERIGPAAEAARLELAYLDFYTGDAAGALARAQAMDANTAADVANDALLLRLLLTENVNTDSSTTQLAAYARAALRLRQGHAEEAVGTLDSLITVDSRHPVADDAAFLRALALRGAGRTSDALHALASFAGQHPESFLVERSRFLVAEVNQREAHDPAAARAAYADFLARHPRSVLAPEARARLRLLTEPG